MKRRTSVSRATRSPWRCQRVNSRLSSKPSTDIGRVLVILVVVAVAEGTSTPLSILPAYLPTCVPHGRMPHDHAPGSLAGLWPRHAIVCPSMGGLPRAGETSAPVIGVGLTPVPAPAMSTLLPIPGGDGATATRLRPARFASYSASSAALNSTS